MLSKNVIALYFKVHYLYRNPAADVLLLLVEDDIDYHNISMGSYCLIYASCLCLICCQNREKELLSGQLSHQF